MRGLIVFAAVAVCALARPDIGLKLRQQQQQHFQPPSTNYGVPSGSYLPSSVIGGDYNSGRVDYDQHSTSHSHTITGQDNGHHHGYDQGNNVHHGYDQGNVHHGLDYDHSSQSTHYTNQGYDTAPQVQKHIYFYDAPEAEHVPQVRVKVQPAAPKKNYKIIFIKAPSYAAPVIPQIPVQQQHEEKTLVYVLVKKPEEGQDIVIPTAAPAKPSKPEVFFIKYKTQKEAEEKIHSIQQGSTSGNSVSDVGSDSFISTIHDNHHGHQDHNDHQDHHEHHYDGSDGDHTHDTTGNNIHYHGSSSSTHGTSSSGPTAHHGDANYHGSTSQHAHSTHNYGPSGASGPY